MESHDSQPSSRRRNLVVMMTQAQTLCCMTMSVRSPVSSHVTAHQWATAPVESVDSGVSLWGVTAHPWTIAAVDIGLTSFSPYIIQNIVWQCTAKSGPWNLWYSYLESNIVWMFADSGRSPRKLLGWIVLFVCRIVRLLVGRYRMSLLWDWLHRLLFVG